MCAAIGVRSTRVGVRALLHTRAPSVRARILARTGGSALGTAGTGGAPPAGRAADGALFTSL
eukprot:2765035-Rhodomonas_salina.1